MIEYKKRLGFPPRLDFEVSSTEENHPQHHKTIQIISVPNMASFTLCSALLAFTSLVSSSPTSLFERGTCSTPDGAGTCLATSSCTTGGFHVAGYCPGPTDIQCCVEKTCTTASGSGMCMNTQNTCSGSFVAGACPGPSDVQVCTYCRDGLYLP